MQTQFVFLAAFFNIFLIINVEGKCLNNVCSTYEAYVDRMCENSKCWYDPDVEAIPKQRAENNGWALEDHKIETPDGYILPVYRLKSPTGTYGKQPVFVQHGMGADAGCFMSNKNLSIAFFLAKRGFDVWLGNYRGSAYSSHATLTYKDQAYWDFSFHEHGVYDLPACFEYITSITKKKLIYVGHSMGATGMAIFMALKPLEAQKHVKHAILLSAAVYMRHQAGIVNRSIVENFYELLTSFLPSMKIYALLEVHSFDNQLFRRLTNTAADINFITSLLEVTGGKSIYPNEPEKLPILLHSFRNAGLKDVQHYMQIILSKRFAMFDYGPNQNVLRYGSESPPEYDLSAFSVPVSWVYGTYDNLANKEDIKWVFETFKKPDWDIYEVPHNHYDLLYLKVVDKTFLPVLLKIVNKYLK